MKVVLTVLLLIISNAFMTYAWYGHLRHRAWPLVTAIVVSWGIAFFEYCFQVPANRLGYGQLSGYQLKIIQEVITLSVFAAFAYKYLGESMRWNYAVSFAFVLAAVVFAFWKPATVTEKPGVREQHTLRGPSEPAHRP